MAAIETLDRLRIKVQKIEDSGRARFRIKVDAMDRSADRAVKEDSVQSISTSEKI
jgi:hypothetical protein